MHGSLVGRIARYGASGLRDPREDRLTEVVAAVFEADQCAGLARHVALEWLGVAAADVNPSEVHRICRLSDRLNTEGEWSCTASTQVRFSSADGVRQPDLELRFAHVSGLELLIWVEVKDGSPPHTRQLAAYADEQRRRGREDALVVLVAPRLDYSTFAPDELPEAVPQLTWEQTAEALRAYTAADAVEAFLLDDLLTYLDEEGLVDPRQLTEQHVVALVHHRDALAALHRVCQIAADAAAQRWNAPADASSYPDRNPREYWWTYPSVPRGGEASDLEHRLEWTWQLLPDSAYVLKTGRPGVPCVLAGVTGHTGTVTRLSLAARDALRRAGFEVLGTGDSASQQWDYVVRIAYPDTDAELFAGDDVVAQGRTLGAWIDLTFRDARRALSAT
jgi:hypothetical protein